MKSNQYYTVAGSQSTVIFCDPASNRDRVTSTVHRWHVRKTPCPDFWRRGIRVQVHCLPAPTTMAPRSGIITLTTGSDNTHATFQHPWPKDEPLAHVSRYQRPGNIAEIPIGSHFGSRADQSTSVHFLTPGTHPTMEIVAPHRSNPLQIQPNYTMHITAISADSPSAVFKMSGLPATNLLAGPNPQSGAASAPSWSDFPASL